MHSALSVIGVSVCTSHFRWCFRWPEQCRELLLCVTDDGLCARKYECTSKQLIDVTHVLFVDVSTHHLDELNLCTHHCMSKKFAFFIHFLFSISDKPPALTLSTLFGRRTKTTSAASSASAATRTASPTRPRPSTGQSCQTTQVRMK
jgi:hypothetical protein